MFKFIHAADLHLDSPPVGLERFRGAPTEKLGGCTREALRRLVQTALDEDADFMLLVGDIFDAQWRDFNSAVFLREQLKTLEERNVPVYIAAGDEDAAGTLLRAMPLPANAVLFPIGRAGTEVIEDLKVALHGCCFADPALGEETASLFPEPLEGCFNIGLLHANVDNRAGQKNIAPCTAAQLSARGYDYWALGHAHAPEVLSQSPPIIYAGCPQGLNSSEEGPRGCFLVTVADDLTPTYEFRELDRVRWSLLEVDCSGRESAEGVVIEAQERATQALADAGDRLLACRLRLIVRPEVADRISLARDRWSAELRQALARTSSNRVWIERVLLRIEPERNFGSLTRGYDFIGRFSAGLEEAVRSEALRKGLAGELEGLRSRLPRDSRPGAEPLDALDPVHSGSVIEAAGEMIFSILIEGAPSENS